MTVTIDSYSESNFSGYFTLYATASIRYISQSFTVGSSLSLNSCKFYIRKTGSPTGNIYAHVYAHTGTYGSGSKPTGSPLATSDALDITTVGTSYSLKTFSFSGANQISLAASTYYVIVIQYNSGGNSTNYLRVGRDNTSSTHSGNAAYSTDGSAYTVLATDDTIFYVYGDTGGTLLTKNISDTVNLTTGQNYAADMARNDTVNLSDTFGASITLILALMDSLSLSDGSIKSFQSARSDSLSLSDSATKSFSIVRSDAMTVADALANHLSLISNDKVNLHESLMKSVGLSLADVVSIKQTIRKHIDQLISDPVYLAEMISRAVELSYSDQFSLQEAVAKQEQINLADHILAEDEFVTLGALILSLTDSIAVHDLVGKSIVKVQSDFISLTDGIFKLTEILKYDTIQVSDHISKLIQTVQSDGILLSDFKELSMAFNLSLSDTLLVADSFVKMIGKSLIDHANLSADLTRAFHQQLESTVTFTDHTYFAMMPTEWHIGYSPAMLIHDEISKITTNHAYDSNLTIEHDEISRITTTHRAESAITLLHAELSNT